MIPNHFLLLKSNPILTKNLFSSTAVTRNEVITFDDYAYQRPDIAHIDYAFSELLQAFSDAPDAAAQADILMQMSVLKEEFASMNNIMHIRHTNNTYDQFYDGENDFFDENSPELEAMGSKLNKALLASVHRAGLEDIFGKQLFRLAEMSSKTFDPIILEDLQEENRLCSEYTKIKASAQLDFMGERHNLSSIFVHETSVDRDVRKAAYLTKWEFYAQNSSKIEGVFHRLVQLRHKIAQKLGFKNFIALGYARMNRSDYNAEKVANFRRQVHKHIVPISTELYERQQQRLAIDNLKIYDEENKFSSGNAKPKGPPEWIVDNAEQMYHELSDETSTFFDFMRSRHLMDLTTRDGKAPGGYCTYISKFQAPYIFSNFNGTSGDIDVLTHEAGHAFQVFMSRGFELAEYHWPTFEACEIHSMSMEFFTWPWMSLFFEEDTEKYKFAHLAGALQFIPYGVAVDEFQHVIYENPTMTPTERNTAWREIEKKYMPNRDFDGNSFLEGGGYWQKQSHIFQTPFYYIDYTLAQICAFQFWKKDHENHEAAWADYLTLCKAGGSQSFLELVHLANLQSPFDNGCVASVIDDIKAWLDGVDDASF